MPEPVCVLLDESIPETLRREFSASLAVETVRYRGWTGLKNGMLLRAAEADFDVLVTVDKGLLHQQNIRARDIAVVILDAGGTTFADLVPMVPAVESAIREATPGAVVVVAR
jgi:predicted nuclease of predicted toxin-antitoxin system